MLSTLESYIAEERIAAASARKSDWIPQLFLNIRANMTLRKRDDIVLYRYFKLIFRIQQI